VVAAVGGPPRVHLQLEYPANWDYSQPIQRDSEYTAADLRHCFIHAIIHAAYSAVRACVRGCAPLWLRLGRILIV
jgi:hypothetical protein